MAQIDHAALKVELETDPAMEPDGTTPDPMGYTGDHSADAKLLNDPLRRPALTGAEPGELFIYLGGEKARDDNSETPTAIFGRLKQVDEAGTLNVGNKVFGNGAGFSELTADGLSSTRVLIAISETDLLAQFALNTADNTFRGLLNDVVSTGAMKNQDRDNIIAMANGTQSRATELGFPRVRARDCEYARSL